MSGTAPRSSPVAIFAGLALFLVGVAVVAAISGSISPLLGYLAGINVAAIALYGYDKRAAVKSRLRVPENVLHGVALLGGSPAALLSQKLFRHKTVKPSFRITFWLIVVVQVAGIAAALWWRHHPPSWLPESLRAHLR
jgi:uncharacterized membrane protein YsdA (DUF1294 family)